MGDQEGQMSASVPAHLSHLRTDRRGLPVPYINMWGVEDEERMSIRFDHWVGGPAIFMDDSEQETPDFTRQNMQRQRECMIRGLCQVCGRPVPWSRRFLVVAALSVETITLEGRKVPVVTEPWLDDWCADFAISKCPALIRHTREEELGLVSVTARRDTLTVMSRGWVEGPLEVESRRLQPAMWAKLILTRYELRVSR
jgi:hypothetical protein